LLVAVAVEALPVDIGTAVAVAALVVLFIVTLTLLAADKVFRILAVLAALLEVAQMALRVVTQLLGH
jgi:hypothetical protein